MIGYVLRRLLVSGFVLLGLALLAFALVRLVPGDTVTAFLGARYDEADAAALRNRYGLDRPLPVQFGRWLGGVVQGDLGTSTTGRPVAAEIAERLPVTLELAAIALLVALAAGVPLGIVAALRPGSATDRLASGTGLLGISMPGFWLATVLILVFALELRWLPPGGWVSPLADPAANLRSMLLPGLALGAAVTGVLLRMTRSAMLEALQADHVRTAKAMGLGPLAVLLRHALRPALVPILTVLGIQAGYLLGGSVVIEQVFSLPGIGQLAFQALERRDYVLLQAVVLLIGTAFVAINLAVDLLYGLVDPRITEGQR
ncbi:ABC transporter permease [Vulgatibacter sp.]|uniref:ABC transporter permease n=1 Tax=Vulgatibacter sp. TaxID=1971226 RepID=UPI0035639914